jgi:hypothetical protein
MTASRRQWFVQRQRHRRARATARPRPATLAFGVARLVSLSSLASSARVYALLVAFACAAVVPVPVLGAASAIVPVHGGATEVLELHGSGTTNPSKLFWKVMDILEERSKKPLTMTYRAVGASARASPAPTIPKD